MFGNTANSRLETDCLDFVNKSVSFRSLKWKRHLIHQHTIRLPKPGVASVRTKAGKGRASQAAESFLISDEESECNPTSIVYDMEDAQWLSENDEDEWFDVADNGSGNRGVDSDPDNWSLVSGPSSPYPITTGTMCVDCMDLIEKAKNVKTPLKKKRPSDPKSLLCDQWVLNKKRPPTRIPYGEGNLVKCIASIKKRQHIRAMSMLGDQEEPEFCSRPHSFLQRNLRRCTWKPMKRTRRKKRRRVQSFGRVNRKQKKDKGQAVKLTPGTVSADNTTRKPPPSFKDFLVQLQGNRSMIIKETH